MSGYTATGHRPFNDLLKMPVRGFAANFDPADGTRETPHGML
jgi:hypothetical protein